MINAINILSQDEGFCKYLDYQDSKSSGQIKSPQFLGNKEKPVHIIDNNAPVEDIIISKIIEYCTKTGENKTALQIWDKGKKTYRDVACNDFTVLVRGRQSADKLIAAFKDAGIPFMWHKDDSLFADKEAADWSALLAAIEAPDFNSTNRGILRKALKTAFFDVSLDELGDEKYDDILCPERQTLLKWRNLATNRQYPKLLNSIFEESGLATRLASYDKLQS